MRGSGVIACVFDFDDTVAPDSTTKFLISRGVDAEAFWQETRRRAEEGWDPTLAWLHLFLEQCGDGRPLGRISNADLSEFGKTLDGDFHPGFPELLADLHETAAQYRDIKIEYYILSGGLRSLIEGSQLISEHFEAVYGCELEEVDGVVARVRRCITFTEKTRYLFEINKGIPQPEADRNPYLVNRAIAQPERRVPFENMIYVGDGLTDIPCFSLIGQNRGFGFGVFEVATGARRALSEFLQQGRVLGMYAPRYGREEDLGSLLRATVAQMCTRIEVERRSAYSG